MTLRILTLNAGLLKLFGGRVATAPEMDSRAKALGGEICKIGADIILLQEIYMETQRAMLTAELGEAYPWAGNERRQRLFSLENSLLTFSRFPMSTSLELFKDAPIDERLFDQKGILTSRIDTGVPRHVTILNFHTTAGGFWLHPESAKADRIRDRQIAQLLRAADRARGTVIMAGDLNAGPGVSDGNFRSILQAGFVSVHDDLHPGATDYTWQPSNRLNVSGPHHMCPPQRIDHVFIRKQDRDAGHLIPIRSQVCLEDEVVKGTDGKMYSVSDHYGLCVELDFSA